MFETSFLLGLKHLLINIIIPLIPGILFLWIFFGKKFSGILLYILSWFVGVGVIAFSLFNIQFIHFGVGVGEYLLIVGLLFAIFVGRMFYKKLTFKEYFITLKIKNIFSDIKHSFDSLSKIEKIFTRIIIILGLGFLAITFIRSTHFPTYADDSFGNRNGPAYNIYADGGVRLFGDKSEILGRGRLGYPIYIPIYKATISHIAGGFDDIYINLWQWLVFLGIIIFIFTITFQKTKNIFYSLLPIGLLVSLPLVFFHVGEGYMELPSAVFFIMTLRALYEFLEKKDYDYITLGILLGSILSHIKNDGFVVYLPGLFIGFIFLLFLRKEFFSFFEEWKKSIKGFLISLFFMLRFLFPFLFIKMIYGLGFNQASGVESGIGISNYIHREIFTVFPSIFMKMDNFNVVLILLLFFVFMIIRQKWFKQSIALFFYSPLFIFVSLLLVFLLTENYRFALDQTTINRVFTVVFVILFAFSGYVLNEQGKYS